MTNDKTPNVTVKLMRLEHGEGLALPAYQTEGASGLDLLAAIEPGQILTVQSGAYTLVPTGVSMVIEPGFEAQVRPRSGLAAKHGVTVLNTPGTIDSDYRGEIKVILINHGQDPFEIKRGDRIAQIVIQKVERVELVEVEVLSETSRGQGGFGSTGD